MNNALRIIVAGGGTGGHVYPGIAIVEAMREVGGVEALFVGARGGVEAGILSRAGLAYELLPGYGLRRASPARRLAFPAVFGAGVAGALRILRRFQPDVVLGTGGYASAAAVVAAVPARRPRVLQEQNSIPGMVNRRLARLSNLVLLGYAGSEKWLPAGVRSIVVGNPVRRLPRVSREAAAEFFHLDPARPTVLVVGGSRGAHSLNEAAATAALSVTRSRGAQFVILAGGSDRAEIERRTAAVSADVRVLDYLDEMQFAYAIADVAVARSGASSVFELAAAGVPALFVPYPYAADDHQAANAAPLVAAGAAVTVADGELGGGRLGRELESLLEKPEALGRMSSAMRAWSTPDAATRAAGAIVDLLKKKSP